MAKTGNTVIIDYIVSCLKLGEERGKILAKVVKKWQTSDRTFDRSLKIAKQQHVAQQEAIKYELAELDKQAAIEVRQKAIMTADERKEYLTVIINCKSDIKKFDRQFFQIVELSDGRKEFISMADKLKAISELNKMGGDYAPTKVSQTDNEGNNAPPSINITQYISKDLIILENE